MKMTGAQIVVQVLEEQAIEHVFGIPGTHNIELYDTLVDSKTITPVLVTDEQSTAFMADGVARTSGKLAALNLVPGAGLTHALSGIAECYLDQIPLLVLLCGIRNDTGASYQLHDIDQCKIVEPVCKKLFRPSTLSDLYPQLSEACEIAKSSPPGPVVVEIPCNLYMFADSVRLERSPTSVALPSTLPKLSPIIEELGKAGSVALYVGLGAIGAQSQLVELAETLDAIVYTSISAKGLFPEDHARWGWNTAGPAAPRPIRKFFDQADCVLAIGCRFAEVATASYGMQPPKNLIHIDIDSNVFNQNYPAKHTLVADATTAVSQLLQKKSEFAKPKSQAKLEQLRRAHREVSEREALSEQCPTVAPKHLFHALQDIFGDDAIFATDSGNGLFLAMENLRLSQPRSFIGPVDYSCMGYSIPAAIGAKMASPNRPVVCLTGDGAFLMTGLELMTASQYQAGIIVCILNDGKLSQIAQFQKGALGRESCSTLPVFDFESAAKAVGAHFERVQKQGQLQSVLLKAQEISQSGRPVLIDIPIDYSQKTQFTKGVVRTNFGRLSWSERIRFVSRVIRRKLSKRY